MSKPNTPAEALHFVENAGATLINDYGAIALDILRATIRRDWAVRVLDAWALDLASRQDAGYPEHWACFPWGDMVTACGEHRGRDCVCGDCESLAIREFRATLSGDGGQIFSGPDPDAARHAAALAVFPTLPAKVRAELGECP